MLYRPKLASRVIRRVVPLSIDQLNVVILACDIADQPEKSEIVVFDIERNVILH